jgi:hypothetical protein
MKIQKLRTPRLLVLFALGCFALSPMPQAVTPPPDGGYAGGNTAEGTNALSSLTTGTYNTAIGVYSLLSLGGGSFNTAIGAGTLLANTADEITACGSGALLSNTTGEGNTANGAFALFSNTEGNLNTAVGDRVLFTNTTGSSNTANGESALLFNTAGDRNTANGSVALFHNTDGSDNTASGYFALGANTMGSNNTVNGASALSSNTTGAQNTASGAFALSQSTGDNNTAIGAGALQSSTTGNGKIALGASAGSDVTTASNVIAIGTSGDDLGNTCFIGQIYINVQPQVGTDPDLVTINNRGRLGRANVSSRRYKHDIQPMDKASEAIYTLKPVSFRYHKEYDPTQTIAFGLIAEEVADVAPHLVGRNPDGQPESVRYEQINAMLLNEFLKEHARVEEQDRKIQKQGATITRLKQDMDALVARLKEHDSKIQRVADKIEMSSSASQMALSD